MDPGLILWLATHARVPLDELNDTLEHRSGLAGLAGNGDMRAVLTAADDGQPDAVLARDVYVHRLRGLIASMTAALGGLDALVFTGGVGEHSAQIRARTMDGLGFLGIKGDPARNESGDGDREIGAPDAAAHALVVNAREDIEIAHQTREVSTRR